MQRKSKQLVVFCDANSKVKEFCRNENRSARSCVMDYGISTLFIIFNLLESLQMKIFS